jgi:hypothetical protein
MALTPEEQELFDKLTNKAQQVEEAKPAKLFEDVYDVLDFLVHHSTAFSGNEDARNEAKEVIAHAKNPEASANGTGSETD